jgi:choline dehydrogenase-like flavoprotein
MTVLIDAEDSSSGASDLLTAFDVVIIGGGPSGITLARELAGPDLRICLVESGSLAEDQIHEDLNEVDVCEELADPFLQDSRTHYHKHQLKFWSNEVQRFGVRCRVLGGSTAGWAGKVAAFDDIDFQQRDWIESSGWPIRRSELAPYLERAAAHLDLGPLVSDRAFFPAARLQEPSELANLENFSPFLWQFSRSRKSLTDVMRFGPDFLGESHPGVTVLYNATVVSLIVKQRKAAGVEIRSSVTGRVNLSLHAPTVIVASGAIENARILLVSRDDQGEAVGSEATGQYLTDHPCVTLGNFTKPKQDHAAKVFGFFPFWKDFRCYMYSLGLAATPSIQKNLKIPHLAIFASPTISEDDPLLAVARLAKGRSTDRLADAKSVLNNLDILTTALGRKFVNYEKIPRRLRRLVTDIAIKVNANFVAGDYQSGGRGRKLEGLALNLICEQPPRPDCFVSLSERRDRLGVPMARVTWSVDDRLRRAVLEVGRMLTDDFARCGIEGFVLTPEMQSGDPSALMIHDMAHTAGTTRMGSSPSTSVVDTDCQVHGVDGLYVVGASVFPTSGHANPTLMVVAFAIRLADHVRGRLRSVVSEHGRQNRVPATSGA